MMQGVQDDPMLEQAEEEINESIDMARTESKKLGTGEGEKIDVKAKLKEIKEIGSAVLLTYTTRFMGVYTVSLVGRVRREILDEKNEGKEIPEDEIEKLLTRPADEPIIIHSGFMTKQGMAKKTWKKRFFTLDSDYVLTYYEDETKAKKKGEISLQGYTVKGKRENDEGRGMKMTKTKSGRIIQELQSTELEVEITGTEEDEEFTVFYKMKCKSAESTWYCKKSYSQFAALRNKFIVDFKGEEVKAEQEKIKGVPFPGKMSKVPDRQEKLAAWVNGVHDLQIQGVDIVGLFLDDEALDLRMDQFEHCIEIAHPSRRDYYFVLDTDAEVEEWEGYLDNATKNAASFIERDEIKKKAYGAAYDAALAQTGCDWRELGNTKEPSGTPAEALNALILHSIETILDLIVNHLPGPAFIQDRAAKKIIGTVRKTLRTTVSAGFAGIDSAMKAARPAVTSALQKGLEQFVKAEVMLTDKIKGVCQDKLAPMMKQVCEPIMKPIFAFVLAPLMAGFRQLFKSFSLLSKKFVEVAQGGDVPSVGEFFTQYLPGWFGANPESPNSLLHLIYKAIGPIWETLQNVIGTITAAVTSGDLGALGSAAKDAIKLIKPDAMEKHAKSVNKLSPAMREGIKEGAALIPIDIPKPDFPGLEKAKEILDTIMEWLGNISKGVMDQIKGLLDSSIYTLQKAFDALAEAGGAVKDKAVELGKEVFEKLKWDTGLKLIALVCGFIKDLVMAPINKGVTLLCEKVLNPLMELIPGPFAKLISIEGLLSAMVGGLVGTIVETVGKPLLKNEIEVLKKEKFE